MGVRIPGRHLPRLGRMPVLPRLAVPAAPASGQEQALEGLHRVEQPDRRRVEVRFVGDILSKVFVTCDIRLGQVPLGREDVIVEDDTEVGQAEVLQGVDEAVL